MAKFLDNEKGLPALWKRMKEVFAKKTDLPASSDATPSMDGEATSGESLQYAKGDHVHPTDTSRAPKSHADENPQYGAGTDDKYGHVKLSDDTDSTSAVSAGIAATPKAVKEAISTSKAYMDEGHMQQFGTCASLASDDVKVVTCEDYVLADGNTIIVTFTNANESEDAQLNVNNTGAKNIIYGGASVSSSNTFEWPANSTLEFIYDGEGYKYAGITALEIDSICTE